MPASPPLTGGCLCGAVRYEAAAYDRAVHCHCGMCRRATGAAFATWVCIADDDLTFTAGEPRYRRSSEHCRRGFCPDCGSALLMNYDTDREVAVSLGSLDEPERVTPSYSIWTSERLSCTADFDAVLRRYPHGPPG